jgi:hypothetical protein
MPKIRYVKLPAAYRGEFHISYAKKLSSPFSLFFKTVFAFPNVCYPDNKASLQALRVIVAYV